MTFFVSEMSAHYNTVRSLAQYFMEGRDLTLNRTRFSRAPKRIQDGFSEKKKDGSLGPLSALFKCGNTKEFLHINPNRDLLFKELSEDPIGYLVIQPSLVESLFYDNDLAFLADRSTKLAILTDEETDDDLRNRFSAVGIPVRAIYSSQEVGFIGAECKDCPGVLLSHYFILREKRKLDRAHVRS